MKEFENAEIVGYPVVWEEVKLAENEVPYNIREEQTIDTSSVFTANNDTTTWMATVIPWVNAPKLIASTSIYWELWGWWGESTVWWANLAATISLWYPNNTNKDFKTFTLSDAWGDEVFSNSADGLVCPWGWWYQLDLTFPFWWGSFCVDTYVKTGSWETLYTDYWTYNSTVHTATVRFKLDAWDTIYLNCQLHYTGGSDYFSYSRDFSAVITKL